MKHCIKYRFLFIVVLLFTIIVQPIYSQTYNNEWIKNNQTYYRFSIPKTGVYRVSIAELREAKIPIDDIYSDNIQLFFKGEEIPCFIDKTTVSLNYIEFFAEKNDGWFDLDMYVEADNQTNPYFSMITDTAAVFFTWNSSFSNKRYSPYDDQDFENLNPSTHCYIDTVQEYLITDATKYLLGPDPIDYEYTEAEGFYDPTVVDVNQNVKKTLGSPNVYANNTNAFIDFAFVSRSNHRFHINISGPGINKDTIFDGIKTIKYKQSINATTLGASNVFVFDNISYNGTTTAQMQLSYFHLKYPSTFNFEGYSKRIFSLPTASGNRQYINLSGFNGGESPVLYDLTGENRILPIKDGNNYKAIISASTQANDLVIVKQSEVLSVTQIEACNFVKNYAGISSKYIVLSHPKLKESAENYAAYRNGVYINVEDLYNQFGYGIKKHPLAIRNFLNFALNEWATKPEYLLIVGKGIAHKEIRFWPTNFNNCLVPPMGEPASDVLLSARIVNNQIYSAIKTGRIAAQSNQEAEDYLDKVKEFELNEPGEWMKRGLHFGGGSKETEQAQFKGYLENYERIFSDSLFGGFISMFLKETSDPITILESDSINNLIDNGISIMTFFGHGTVSGFDQNIDSPTEYNNKGKYPLLIANSCYSGDMFKPGNPSTSEEWVLIKDKGSIGYFAVVYQGIASYLNTYSNEFYSQLSSKSYNESLGQQIINTQEFMSNIDNGGKYKSTVQGFNLHGDPAVVLNSHTLPDLYMDKANISFNPANITTEIDSFNLIIKPTNIARTTGEDFSVSINRIFANGEIFDTIFIHRGLLYKDTVSIKLPTDKFKGFGTNTFRVTLDSYNTIEELNEGNNEAYAITYISSTDIFPTIPYNQSLITEQNPTLKFSTGDPFVKEQVSIFQIDTSHYFNSPLLIETERVHTGGIIEWNPGISFNQNDTYFWRSAKKENNPDDVRWSMSSFKISESKKGWQQDRAGQMVTNKVNLLELNEENGDLTFSESAYYLKVNTKGLPSYNDYYDIKYSINGNSDFGSCGLNKLVVVILDPITLIPWESDRGDYNQEDFEMCYSSRSRPDRYFIYNGNYNSSVDDLINFVNNDVPDGYHVVIYTAGNAYFSKWSESNISGFEAFNPDFDCRVRFMENNEPYIYYFQKGSDNPPVEKYGDITEALVLNESIETDDSYGEISRFQVGPAKNWDSFSANVTRSTNPAEQSFFRILGTNSSGSEIILYDSISGDNLDISDIQSSSYTYLTLKFITSNPITFVPDQLESWEIIYEPFPDLAINPQRGGSFYADTLQEGDDGSFSVAYENIGYESLDSVRVSYWIQDGENSTTVLKKSVLAPLQPGEFSFDTAQFSTRNQSENQTIWSEFNPISTNRAESQQGEQSYFNNVASKSYYVKKDDTNPVLDVTFDGIHIMDGDIVSSYPEINIQLKDENQYIALNDVSSFKVYIKSQKTGIEDPVELGNNPDISFIPAELPQNKAQLIYERAFEEDGIYELRVQAVDPSSNTSGKSDYNISFEVINESTITNVFNYPNPFSTATQFVFEITGNEIPDELRIEILTVTGKIVEVVYLEDLGPLNVGKNISEYRWDGRDMYGDPLANGVYFYRVFARLHGQELKIRDTGTSQYFKNGFGKMYLMR